MTMCKKFTSHVSDQPARPDSTDSETGSRSSSRVGSRQTGKPGRGGKKSNRNKEEMLDTLHEDKEEKKSVLYILFFFS